MNKRYYIAYGSNLNKEQMLFRCPDAELIGTAVLRDYRLLFKGEWNEAWLTIESREGSGVPIAVWKVSVKDEMMLNRYEGYPLLYYKEELLLPFIECEDTRLEDIPAFVYIMQKDAEPAIPSQEYVAECMEGYRDFGFDPALILEALEETRRRVSQL